MKSPLSTKTNSRLVIDLLLLPLLVLQLFLLHRGRVACFYTLEEEASRESNGWLIDEFNKSSRDPSSPDLHDSGHARRSRFSTANSTTSESSRDGGSGIDQSRSMLTRPHSSLNLTAGLVEVPNGRTSRVKMIPVLTGRSKLRKTARTSSSRPAAGSKSSPPSFGSTEPSFWDYGSKDDVEPVDYDYQSVLKDEPESTCYGFLRLRRKYCKNGYGIGNLGLVGILAAGFSFVLVLMLCVCKGCRYVQIVMKRRMRYVPVSTKD